MNLERAFFNRSWAVTIGKQGETGNKYTGLRVTFDIEKTSDPNPNKAKIEVYNLSAQSRQIFQKGFQIRVDAGYQNNIETLYIGDIVKVTSKRTDTSIVTTFECGDSERQLINAHFDRSYGAGTTNVAVLQDLANALGVSVGSVLGLPKVVYNTGISFTGSVKRAIERLTKGLGLEFSVQNGVLQIIPQTAHNGEEAIILSQDSGLIGVPSQGDGFVQFSCLLNPRLKPTTPIQITSQTINGFFKVRKTKIEGDTHGDKWDIQGEAVPINAQQVIPANAGNDFSKAVVS